MSFIKHAKRDARWMSSAEVDEEIGRRNNLHTSSFKREGSSSLYEIPEFQHKNDDGDHSLRNSTSCDKYSDSEQSTASEELQEHKASYSKISTLARINKESALLNRKQHSRESTQSKVWRGGQALFEAQKEEVEAQHTLSRAKIDFQISRQRFNAALDAVGMSRQLLGEYQAFCDSLQPQDDASGFATLFDESHGGNYVDYDPEFDLFKDNVLRSYKNKNFRCEASSKIGKGMGGTRNKRTKVMEYEVEFFPLPDLEPTTGSEKTWGEQYPKLYNIAITAAKMGSDTAFDILVRLPGKECRCSGGWLFDYEFDELAKNILVVSDRWKFRSAHFIDQPVSTEEKKRCLRLEYGIC